MIICSALSKDISELNLSLDTINMINIAFIHAYFNKKEGRSNGNIPQNRPDHHAACLASALSRIYLRYTSSMPFSLLCCLGSGSASHIGEKIRQAAPHIILVHPHPSLSFYSFHSDRHGRRPPIPPAGSAPEGPPQRHSHDEAADLPFSLKRSPGGFPSVLP